jgi:hypothetical protein
MAVRYHPNGLRVIDQELINEVVDRIVRAFNPIRIVVFGSHARGDAGPDSDLDLMVEMESTLPWSGSWRSIACSLGEAGRWMSWSTRPPRFVATTAESGLCYR